MLAKIIGWFWVAMGVLFLIRPNFLKTKLQKKGLKKLKKLFFSIAIILGIFLITAAWKMQGLASKIIMLLGIVAIIKGIFLLKAKVAEKIVDWASKQPLLFFRVIASFYIVIGVIILLGLR